MVRAQEASTNLDHLTGLKQELADRQLVLNGVFDEQIKKLEAVRDEAIEKLGIVDSVKASDQYRIDADAYALTTRAAADKDAATAKSALSQANAKMDAALTKEKSVNEREEQALALMADYHAKADAFDADCAAREAAIATREAAIAAREQQHQADAATFAAQKAEALRKLKAAQELAAS